VLPPGWQPARIDGPAVDVEVRRASDDWAVVVDDDTVVRATDPDGAVRALDAQLRATIALHAPGHVFVHAGVVALGSRAIVLPGSSLAGKTTLVAALIRRGAAYYSDEFAVLDADGLVYPYAKPLSIRGPDGRATRTPAAALGAVSAGEPAPIGMIAVTAYRPGSDWAPQPISAGAAMLELLQNAIPARTRPEQTMACARAAVSGAEAWSTARGEAEQAAEWIADRMASVGASAP